MGERVNPYEAPRLPEVNDGWRFEPLGWRTPATITGLFATVGLSIALPISELVLLDASRHEQATIGTVFAAVAVAALAVSIGTAALFLSWQYRAAANVLALGQYALEITPRWGVLAWFVPVISLFVPYQALSEIWRASDPETVGTDDTSWVTRPVTPLLPLWWTMYLLNMFVSVGGSLAGMMIGNVREQGGGREFGAMVNLGATFFSLLAAICIAAIMKAVSRRQTSCAEKMRV